MNFPIVLLILQGFNEICVFKNIILKLIIQYLIYLI